MKSIVKSLFAIITLLSIVVSCTKESSQSEEKTSQSEKTMGAETGVATHISCRNAEISGKANLPGKTSTDLSFGVLYSTSSGVLVGTATQIEAKSFDSNYNYTVNTEALEPETTYYYRGYIIQNTEITYGEVKSFKTLSVSSMIQTLDATEIDSEDAVLNAYLDLTDCNYDGLEYGFEVTPDGESKHTVNSSNHSEKKFTAKCESICYNTTYSVVAYVKLDGRTYKGETKSFKSLKIRESVDLGLSVKWRSWNLGATKPEEYGGYYQWAGTRDVTNTYMVSAPYYYSQQGWTKYVPNSYPYWRGSGSPDNKTVLDPEDDVAHVKLGGKWRMPTIEEWHELMNTKNCLWTLASLNGINGCLVQSKKTGFTNNWIFLPAAGDNLSEFGGSEGHYWSSSLDTDYPDNAWNFQFNSGYMYKTSKKREYGYSVRPVSE